VSSTARKSAKGGARRRTAAPASRTESLTAPVEDYLKVIYGIEWEGNAAATSDIAQRLGIAPASVSGMVRRLAKQGLLAYERYRGVRLTDAGRTAALGTIRRHRVIEAYLVKALGFDWDRVHEEAERLEHAASDALIDRMAEAIGEPLTDPHGAPIPTREGVVDDRPYQRLADLAAGERARVVRVSDEDGALLRYLGSLGLRPGATLRVVEQAPYDGPISLKVGRVPCQVGAPLACRVMVERLAD